MIVSEYTVGVVKISRGGFNTVQTTIEYFLLNDCTFYSRTIGTITLFTLPLMPPSFVLQVTAASVTIGIELSCHLLKKGYIYTEGVGVYIKKDVYFNC